MPARKAPGRASQASRREEIGAMPNIDMKATAISSKMNKAAVLSEIAAATDLTRAQVASVLDGLELLIHRHVKKRGVGEFTIPGLIKIRKVRQPATRKRMGRNPATGEPVAVPAKPACWRLRLKPLTGLKRMIA